MKISELIKSHPDLQKNEPMLFIHRHAEKYTAKEFKDDRAQLLTQHGREAAVALGHQLSHIKIEQVYTSPVDRCVETANEVLKAVGNGIEPVTLNEISSDDAGVYVYNTELAVAHFSNHNAFEIFNTMLDGGNVPGMSNAKYATAILLNELINVKLKSAKSPLLMVTHDSILALLVGTLLDRHFTESNWFGYLEGIAITRTGDEQYKLYWNTECHDITDRCKELFNLSTEPSPAASPLSLNS